MSKIFTDGGNEHGKGHQHQQLQEHHLRQRRQDPSPSQAIYQKEGNFVKQFPRNLVYITLDRSSLIHLIATFSPVPRTPQSYSPPKPLRPTRWISSDLPRSKGRPRPPRPTRFQFKNIPVSNLEKTIYSF